MEMTKDEYLNICYRLKGETVEWSTLIQYQLCYIICFQEFSLKDLYTKPFGMKMYDLYKNQTFNNQINMACSVIRKHSLGDIIKSEYPNLCLSDMLHDIREYRNNVTHKLMEVTKEDFHWDGEYIPFIRTCSIEPFDPNSTEGYVAFPYTANSIETIKENIIRIKEAVALLRWFLKSAHNFHL